MSHLRAPAARADRRDGGGRHGRPVARPAVPLPEAHIRPQLLRLAVLPPIAVGLSACAAILVTARSAGAGRGITLWAVLTGALAVSVAGILIAAVAADRAARSVTDRIAALRRSSARGEADLRAVVEALRRGENAPRRKPRGGPAKDADEFELLAADLARAHDGAVTAVVQAAQLSSQTGSEQKLEVFLNLARRLQSLVHREISILDELENQIEDPDLLKGLFHVDHLATRIRRHAENLAVLGGAVSRRQWSNPVSMTEVLRSAIAEVEQYSRVKLVPPVDGELRGHAVADVIHLLAELVENATVFSAPHTQVLMRANLVTSGLAVEVEDRGLGMPAEEQSRMNDLLADPDQVNVARLLADGRIGLFVVSQLARRHGIRVRLQTNIYGGVQAVLVVPQGLLGTAPGGVVGAVAVPRPADPAAGPAGPQQSGTGSAPEPGRHLAPAAPAVPTGRRRRQQRDDDRGTVVPAALDGSARTGNDAGSTGSTGSASTAPGVSGPVPVPGRRGPIPIPGGTGFGYPADGTNGDGPARTGNGDGPALTGSGPSLTGNGSALTRNGGGPASGSGRGGASLATNGTDPRAKANGAAGPRPGSGTGPAAATNGTGTGTRPEAAGAGPRPGAGIRALPQGTAGPRAPARTGEPDRPPGGVGGADDGGTYGSHGELSAPRSTPDASLPLGDAPAPLPVRGPRGERSNPASAVPGIRPEERRTVAESTQGLPTPRSGAVRGTMGKPRLPRRRAQEHIAPQLRGGPAPRQDSEHVAAHDPGLMAAFQRGVGLAEAQQSLEAAAPPGASLSDVQLVPNDVHLAPTPTPVAVPPPAAAEPALPAVVVPTSFLDKARIARAQPAPPSAPEASGARDSRSAPGPDQHPARHDGSAPAG
ncbi:ATP-binding protein [Streptomyces sp. NPDC059378]|uniref:sensor histidine kinase n=1 Tax=Streptomyces sp. NPDC059378 TaxID=3346815 RepID=UPI0036BA05B1